MLIYSDYKDKDTYFREILEIIARTYYNAANPKLHGGKGLDKDKALVAIRELASAGLQADK